MKIPKDFFYPFGQRWYVSILAVFVSLVWLTGVAFAQRMPDLAPEPFGEKFPNLDSDAVGEWWKPTQIERGKNKGQTQQPKLLVPRDQVVAFALYTQDHGILKLSAQLYPLKPDEPRSLWNFRTAISGRLQRNHQCFIPAGAHTFELKTGTIQRQLIIEFDSVISRRSQGPFVATPSISHRSWSRPFPAIPVARQDHARPSWTISKN